MALTPLSDWQQKFAQIKNVSDGSFGTNLAKYIADQVDGKLEAPGMARDFKFNQSAFANAVSGGDIALAFQAGVSTSSIKPSPPNTAALIDPSSINLGKAVLKSTLANAKPVADASKSLIVQALYNGFKSLQAAVTTPAPSVHKVPLS